MIPTLSRRELLNVAFLAFIPVGETVDAVVVSATTWPDNAPTSNYTNYQIADVETLKVTKEYDTEIFKIPDPAGGYLDDPENTLKTVKFTGVTAKNYSYFTQLEHGLLTPPVVGTAQAPYVNNNDYIEGVMLVEYQAKAGGAVVKREQLWARMRLTDPGDVGPSTRKKTFELEKRPSGNNTFVQVA